jgi:hypothetical protein
MASPATSPYLSRAAIEIAAGKFVRRGNPSDRHAEPAEAAAEIGPTKLKWLQLMMIIIL